LGEQGAERVAGEVGGVKGRGGQAAEVVSYLVGAQGAKFRFRFTEHPFRQP